jgi:hypothetical protein
MWPLLFSFSLSKPSTLYPLPSTLYPLPSTLYPLPSTLYPLPSTLYPLPSTLYPLNKSSTPLTLDVMADRRSSFTAVLTASSMFERFHPLPLLFGSPLPPPRPQECRSFSLGSLRIHFRDDSYLLSRPLNKPRLSPSSRNTRLTG